MNHLFEVYKQIMTTQKYINDNKTNTFKDGDKVIMFNCGEAEYYPNKVWICMSNSFKQGQSDLVSLHGFSGSFSTKYLKHHSA